MRGRDYYARARMYVHYLSACMSHSLRCALISCVGITAHYLRACADYLCGHAHYLCVYARHLALGLDTQAPAEPHVFLNVCRESGHSHSAHSPPRARTHTNTHTPPTCTLPARHAHTHPAGIHTSALRSYTPSPHLPHLKRSPAVAHICAIAMMGLAGAVAILVHGQARAAAIRRGEGPHSALTSPNGRLCIHPYNTANLM